MMHNVMTPDTGVEHMFWPLILRGVGLGLLFVPITTYHYLKRKKNIGEGAAFTGMMRQLGGSWYRYYYYFYYSIYTKHR
jgi:DHA2 family multidrug resistance protein